MVTTHPGRGVQSPQPPQATGAVGTMEYQVGGWGTSEAGTGGGNGGGGDGALRATAYMSNGMAGTMGMPVSMSNAGGSTSSRGGSGGGGGGGGGTPVSSGMNQQQQATMGQQVQSQQQQAMGVMYPPRSTAGARMTTTPSQAAVSGAGFHRSGSGGNSPVDQGGYVGYVAQSPMSTIFYQTTPMPLQMAGHMHAVNALAPSMPVQSMALMEAQPSIPATFYPSGKRAAYGMPHEIMGLEGDMGTGGMMMINGARATGGANGQERRSFYACPRCDKQFTLKGNLKRHQLTHQNHKPYICEICRKGFSRKADLEIHNRVHTGEKPYDCMEPGCGKKFARISDLRSHERTHSGVKAFKCTFRGCERTFARRYDMKKHVKVHNKDTEGRILEHGIHLGYAAPPPPPAPESYHPEDGNGLSPHYGDNQLAGQYGNSMGSAAMARWAQDYIGGAGLELQLQSGREEEEAVLAMQQQQQAMATNDASAAAYYQQAQSQVHHHQQHEQQQRAMGVDGVATSTESVKTNGRGYIYVYHNDHVDMVSPGRALECKDYPNTRIDESNQQPFPILTDVEIRQANEACSGNHGTETCPCVRIRHGDHVDCVVDLRLKHRRADGQLEDHGQIRIIKNEEDNFIQAISSFSSASSPTNCHQQGATNGHSTNTSAKL